MRNVCQVTKCYVIIVLTVSQFVALCITLLLLSVTKVGDEGTTHEQSL